MSYTLRGRLESRLAAAAAPFAVACLLALLVDAWWPVELAGAMAGVGLALDLLVYHRLLPYQPAWAAVPMGAVELGLTMLLARALAIDAPLTAALALFAGAWLLAQLLAHAGLPLARLTYAEDGGELGRGGVALGALAPAVLVASLAVAWASQPPTVRLAAGVHDGPLVLDRELRLVGEPGAVVRGGIVIRADGVQVRDVTVLGGEHGIAVEGARDVLLDGVVVSGASLDGINARRSSVAIRDCTVRSGGRYVQGIDISFAGDLPASTVERCTVAGGLEGIVTHFAKVDVRRNHVFGTRLRAITLTEMSMGAVTGNVVTDALGVAIFCGDYSHCTITDNAIRGTRADPSGNPTRQGFGILSYFGSVAKIGNNNTSTAAFIDGRIEPR